MVLAIIDLSLIVPILYLGNMIRCPIIGFKSNGFAGFTYTKEALPPLF